MSESLQGRRFGDLLVVGAVGSGKQIESWLCRCSCSRYVPFSAAELQYAIDCGQCKTPDPRPTAADRRLKPNHPREYRAWLRYRKQGELCEAWAKSFEQFIADVGQVHPNGNASLRRIDPARPFSVLNGAAWLTPGKGQCTQMVAMGGRLVALRALCDQHGINFKWANRQRATRTAISGEGLIRLWKRQLASPKSPRKKRPKRWKPE